MKHIILAAVTLCLTTFITANVYAETKTPTRFSQRIETPKNKIIQNLANNDDSPLLSNRNKGKSRYERMQARKRNAGNNNATESRTAGENGTNVNGNRNKRLTPREARLQRQKVNDIANELMND